VARADADEAEEFLRGILAHGGVAASEVKKQARQADMSEKCLRTARLRLGVKPAKRNFASGWWWALSAEDALDAEDALETCSEDQGNFAEQGGSSPDQDTEDAQDAHVSRTHNEGILGGGGHLRDDDATVADDAAVVDEKGVI
jgi:hypothetical protein